MGRVATVVLVLVLIAVFIMVGYSQATRQEAMPVLRGTWRIGFNSSYSYTADLYYIAWYSCDQDYHTYYSWNDGTLNGHSFVVSMQVEPNISLSGYYTADITLSRYYGNITIYTASITCPCIFTFNEFNQLTGVLLVYGNPFTMWVDTSLMSAHLDAPPDLIGAIGDAFSYGQNLFQYFWNLMFNPALVSLNYLNVYSQG